MEKRRWTSRLGLAVALVLAGMLAGSVMLTPVGAHITTFNHLKAKHFYTKKAANAQFIDTAEAGETKIVVDGTPTTLELTNSTSFVDVPGAVTSIVIPAGKTAIIHARFSAESACYGNPNNCSVRILIGGTEANPAAGLNFAFDTNQGGDNAGSQQTKEAHSIDRYRPDLVPGTYEVKVQYGVTGAGTTAQLNDWILTVDRITTG